MRRAAEPATELVFQDALVSQEHDYEPLPAYAEVEVTFQREWNEGKKSLARTDAAPAETFWETSLPASAECNKGK